ncbi:MAG: UpxY family transcription antiterminator [Sphingobacteriales bacterium]|jgi:transcription antitermination factor NusG|nr:UpxY family transcription antiterminator [Sphingobacteriales bacterium]
MTAPEKQNSSGYRATKDNSKWYVLITKPRAEKQVSKRFTEMDICHFLPMQKQLRQWHDRRKWVELPLFNRYIFVKTEAQWRSKVFEAGGLLKFISFNGQVAEVPEAEINRIQQLCAAEEPVSIHNGSLQEGDEVEIMAGQLTGLKGTLTEQGDKPKIRIAIPSLGCFASVEIDIHLVRKIAD